MKFRDARVPHGMEPVEANGMIVFSLLLRFLEHDGTKWNRWFDRPIR
jgi:hypothetical protein